MNPSTDHVRSSLNTTCLFVEAACQVHAGAGQRTGLVLGPGQVLPPLWPCGGGGEQRLYIL